MTVEPQSDPIPDPERPEHAPRHDDGRDMKRREEEEERREESGRRARPTR
jgi:hypothetical protein